MRDRLARPRREFAFEEVVLVTDDGEEIVFRGDLQRGRRREGDPRRRRQEVKRRNGYGDPDAPPLELPQPCGGHETHDAQHEGPVDDDRRHPLHR